LRASERVGSDNEKFIASRGSHYEEIEVNHVHAARKERARSNSKERVKRAKAKGQP